MKRDHQKRLEAANSRAGEANSPYSNQCSLGVVTGAVSAAGSSIVAGSATATQVAGGEILVEDVPSGYNSGDEHHERDAGLTESEWKQRDEEFAKTMAKEGLIVKEIEEDGACLFRSISLQMYGDQDMHEDIRQQTMDYIVSDNLTMSRSVLIQMPSITVAEPRVLCPVPHRGHFRLYIPEKKEECAWQSH